MQQLFDLCSALLFLYIYYFHDVYLASAAVGMMAAIKLVLHCTRLFLLKELDMAASWLLVVCGIATWYFHESAFIHWKVSILHALFAAVFFSNYYIRGSSFFQHIIQDQPVTLPAAIGLHADRMMGGFMLSIAVVNYFVFTYCDESTWVYFKSSIFLLNMGYLMLVSLYLSRHIQSKETTD